MIEEKIEFSYGDITTGDELDIYWKNDEPLYKIEQLWVKNYSRKMNRNVYKRDLAIKGILNNFVPRIIKAYQEEFGKFKVNKEAKLYLAGEIVNSIETEIKERKTNNLGSS
jgi:hypothetical protein